MAPPLGPIARPNLKHLYEGVACPVVRDGESQSLLGLEHLHLLALPFDVGEDEVLQPNLAPQELVHVHFMGVEGAEHHLQRWETLNPHLSSLALCNPNLRGKREGKGLKVPTPVLDHLHAKVGLPLSALLGLSFVLANTPCWLQGTEPGPLWCSVNACGMNKGAPTPTRHIETPVATSCSIVRLPSWPPFIS